MSDHVSKHKWFAFEKIKYFLKSVYEKRDNIIK